MGLKLHEIARHFSNYRFCIYIKSACTKPFTLLHITPPFVSIIRAFLPISLFSLFSYTDIDITLSVSSSLFFCLSTFPSLFIPFNSFLPTILIHPHFLLLTVILSRPLFLPSSQFSSKLT